MTTTTSTTPQLVPIGALSMATPDELIEIALATCVSPSTRRVYRTQLLRFLASKLPFNRDGVAMHIRNMRDAGASAATTIACKSAIRKLAQEAQVRHLITHDEYSQINSVSGGIYHKTGKGLWLTVPQVEHLLSLPDRESYNGKRDAAVLSLLVGCGLRREEMAVLTWDQYQSREGRMCLVNLLGKGRKTRTVPVPLWAQADVDVWQIASQLPEPDPVTPLQIMIRKGQDRYPFDPKRIAARMGYHSVNDLVQRYGKQMGLKLSPHDLRRTLAKMMHRSGASLEQIQYTLGHQHIQTTTIYLGATLEMAPNEAAVDKIQIQTNPSEKKRRQTQAAPQETPKAPAGPTGEQLIRDTPSHMFGSF